MKRTVRAIDSDDESSEDEDDSGSNRKTESTNALGNTHKKPLLKKRKA